MKRTARRTAPTAVPATTTLVEEEAWRVGGSDEVLIAAFGSLIGIAVLCGDGRAVRVRSSEVAEACSEPSGGGGSCVACGSFVPVAPGFVAVGRPVLD